MKFEGYSYEKCVRIVSALDRLRSTDEKFGKYLSSHDLSQLLYSCETEGDAGVASFFGVLALLADLLYGFRNKNLWFPCKYFNLNEAYITVIAVTMKLPTDLSSAILSYMDQTAKLGSLVFM